MNEPMTKESRAVVVALGASEAFRGLLAGVEPGGGLRVVYASDAAALFKVAREEVVALLVIDGDERLDAQSLTSLAQLENTSVPVLELVQEVDPIHALDLACRGPSWVVSKSTPPAELRRLLRAISGRRLVERTNQRLVDELSSRVRIQESWGRGMQRAVEEVLHELKTPAGAVQGFCSLLYDQVDGPLELKQRVTVGRMRAAAELIVDVLQKARGRLPPAPSGDSARQASARRGGRRPLRLGELAEELRAVFAEHAKVAGVKIEVERVGEVPEIWADRNRLAQLIVNLLSNALRHTPKDGEITLRVDAESAAESDRPSAVRLTVVDTGPGIPAEDREHIFKSGWSGDGRTGLGLAIAQQVAAEHHAEVRLVSGPGEGAVFTVSLPIDPRERAKAVSIERVEDPALVGQLLGEVAVRGRGPLRVEHPVDMELLADQILSTGGKIILAGHLDERIERALNRAEEGT